MTLAKVGLAFTAVVFIGIGLGFLVVPVQWASVVDISLPTAMARTDFRATYGGFDLAIGVFLGLCALRSELDSPRPVGIGTCGGGVWRGAACWDSRRRVRESTDAGPPGDRDHNYPGGILLVSPSLAHGCIATRIR